MNLLRRSISLLMVGVLALGLAACGSSGQGNEASSWRPDPKPQQEEEKFVDTDGVFEYETVDWAGPQGYVIVVPAGDSNAKKSAEYLQSYYSEVHEITLQIVTDAAKEAEKEILVGKTNRSQSAKDMAENELQVSVKDGKLVFDGGHYVTVDSAVKKFARKLPAVNKAYTFKVTTDFASTIDLEDYEYVWGDEFEAADIDYTKWDFEARMGGCATNEISWDNTAIDVSDGRLKLMASHYFSPRVQGIEYKSPYSVLHKYHMNYLYGYCEIRAKMPFEKGLWPSFWGLSACNLSGVDGGKTKDYGVEVDIFEIFGTQGSVVPNIHKWYRPDYDYNKTHNAPKDADKNHTQYPADLRLTWEWSEHGGNLDTLDNEYHLYGYEWTPTGGSMYVDGEKYVTFDYSKSYDLNGNMNHFRDPMYFMFNMHVLVEGGGMEVNYIDDNKDALPAEYAIDWYRVYQKKDGKSKIWTVDEPYTLVEYKGRDNPWKAE